MLKGAIMEQTIAKLKELICLSCEDRDYCFDCGIENSIETILFDFTEKILYNNNIRSDE